jgi:hypothetical protein
LQKFTQWEYKQNPKKTENQQGKKMELARVDMMDKSRYA